MSMHSKLLLAATAAFLGACGGSSVSGIPTSAQPSGAVATINQVAVIPSSATTYPIISSGSFAMTGGLGVDYGTASGSGRNNALIANSNLNVNFNTNTLSGTASNFAEAVIVKGSNGSVTVQEYVQAMTGTASLTGRVLTVPDGSGGFRQALEIDAAGNLAGTMEVSGSRVAGTYTFTATDNIAAIGFYNGAFYAVGSKTTNIPNLVTVVFQPTSGGLPIPVCFDGNVNCTGVGALSGYHAYTRN